MDRVTLMAFDAAQLFEMKTLDQQCLKATEEMGEFAQAVLSYEKAPGCEYKGKTLEDVIEEGADVIICVMSVLATEKVTPEQLASMMEQKITKWVNNMNKEG